MTPILAMRGVVSFAFILFAILTAPAMISAASTAMVWAGIAIVVVCILLAALTATTPTLDGMFAKIEKAFTKKGHGNV